MSNENFEAAYQYVAGRLTTELAPDLYYHGPHHTLRDVLPAAERLAALAQLPAEEVLLLRTAALYHDMGFIESYQNNEPIAARIAGETLPAFGYSEEQIAVIQALIQVTALPQQPTTLLEQLMCDADLDSLGRDDFNQTSMNLHRELAARGTNIPLTDWWHRQIGFLRDHHYFSDAAKSLRDSRKAENLRILESKSEA
jgi:predicted metal-dependent HD superfamily phosphohydrolase